MVNIKQIKIAQLNIRSLPAHYLAVRETIFNEKIDILGLTETWLKSDIISSSIQIPNYNIIRRDFAARGSGVCFYIRKGIKYKIFATSRHIEQLCVSLEVNSVNMNICVVYRKHELNHKQFLDELEITINNCLMSADRLIILGDMNIDLFKTDAKVTDYTNLVENLGLTQIISEPTRQRALLDHILTSSDDLIIECGVIDFDSSDHDLTYCILNIKKPSVDPVFRCIRDYRSFDQDGFAIALESSNLQRIFYLNNIDDKVSLLNITILDVFDRYAPFKNIRITKPYCPWITDNIRTMQQIRDHSKNKYLRTRSESDWIYYKSIRNYTTLAMKREKQAYYNQRFSARDTATVYRELGKMNIAKNKMHISLDEVGNVHEINDHFIDSVPIIHDFNLCETVDKYTKANINSCDKFCFTLVDTDTVIKIINQIKSKAMGPDLLNINMIKCCGRYLVDFITHIINSCILESYFPSAWKCANVIPLPKKESPETLDDLRPVSILPVLAKVLEKCMDMQLRAYLNLKNILPEAQSGFRTGHNCSTALLNVTDDILRATDVGLVTVLVLLDFSRAFDTVNHDLMLSILGHVGLETDALKLIGSFLQDRSQQVIMNRCLSNNRKILSGVPQGSILSPTLFTIYTHGLPNTLRHCRIQMYADDTQIYLSFPYNELICAATKINSDLERISEYANQHSLVINPNKSQAIVFGNKEAVARVMSAMRLEVQGSSIKFVNEARNLGLLLDNSFRYKNYINQAIKKSYAKLRILYPHRTYLPLKVKKMLCEVFVMSQFSYASPVYSYSLDTEYLQKIQKLQNSCIRFVYGIRKFEHVSHKLKDLYWLNVKNRFHYMTACLFQSVIQTRCPPYLWRKIRYRTDVHNVNVRRKDLLTIPSHKLALFRRSFSYNIAHIFNELPDHLKNLSPKIFKRKYNQYLMEKQ